MWVELANVAFGFPPNVIPRLRAGVGWDSFWFSWPLGRLTPTLRVVW